MKITDLKYREILKKNTDLATSLSGPEYQIKILGNIITSQLNEILEYSLRVDGIPAIVQSGNYNNIVQDSTKYKNTNNYIIFWELCNLIDGFQFKGDLLDNDLLDAIIEKTKSEIDLVQKNLQKTSILLINRFTALPFSYPHIGQNNLDDLSKKLNYYLENHTTPNVRLVNLEKVIASVGILNSFDLRYYHSSKALYTVDFFKAYAQYIKPIFMSANGKTKKALIFDCDNTLWKGTLGEDGFNNIEMSMLSKDGAIFFEIQSMALTLSKKGILIGLCSKNNPKDVDQVIKFHPDMLLRSEFIAINKSNWSDKASNLRKIADELNIGLDSLVFVDDSLFEVNLIRQQLPEVTVLHVPERLHDFPKMLRENIGLFYNLSFTLEDLQRREMYNQNIKREAKRKDFVDIDDYLASIGIKITVFINDQSVIPRLSQISQKTNQFNLTTKRYTESDIEEFIHDPTSDVYALSVSDNFGNYGITGLCIITSNDRNDTVEIDTFLMSCRIIGRNIEYSFLDYVIEKITKQKKSLKSQYIKTKKNEQVKRFYDSCFFTPVDKNDLGTNYKLELDNYKPKQLKYIQIING